MFLNSVNDQLASPIHWLYHIINISIHNNICLNNFQFQKSFSKKFIFKNVVWPNPFLGTVTTHQGRFKKLTLFLRDN